MTVQNVKLVKFGLFSYSVFFLIIEIKSLYIYFLQRNRNISLNDSDNFSALCFLKKNQERSMWQKKHTVGHLKIDISRKYILLLFFSEKCKKNQ